MSHKSCMVIDYSLHNITLQKIFFVYQQTNDRVTSQRLPNYFGGYWELPNNRIANANWVTRCNPGSGWLTDIYPIEEPGLTRGNPRSGWRTNSGNAQLVWLKLIKVYYKFTILGTLQSVINIRCNRYNVIICILKQKQLPIGNN